jgi:hypothetical protein
MLKYEHFCIKINVHVHVTKQTCDGCFRVVCVHVAKHVVDASM